MSEMWNSILAKMKKLTETGFFHIVSSNVVSKIVGFLSTIIIVRILTKPEYGTYTYAMNIYGIVLVLNGMGMDSGVLQLSSEHSGDTDYANRISKYGTLFGLKFNLLLGLILIGIGMFVPLQVEASRPLFFILCALPLFQFTSSMMSCYLRSQKRNMELSRLQIYSSILGGILPWVGAYLFRAPGLILGQYASLSCIILIACFVFKIRYLQSDLSVSGKDRELILKISFISMLNNSLSELLYLLDIFVLGIVDPQETILASYKVATIIPTALAFIPSAVVFYIYPYFAEHREDKQWCLKRYKQLLFGMGSFNLAVSSAIFLLAPFIIRLLFGGQYLDAVPVFRILAVNYFFLATFRIISGNLLVTQLKLKYNLFVAVTSSIINVIADYFFIQWWGAVGAALATVLVVFISSVLSTVYLIRTLRTKEPEDT